MQIPLPPSNLAGSGSLTATGRIPTAPQGAGPPPGPSMIPPMGPRPLAMGGVPPPPSLNSQMPVDAPQSGVRGIVPAQRQFSGVLSSETPMKFQLSWWSDLVKEYFTPNAELKLTLWKDNAKNEAKPFQIGVPIMPRFFLVTTQSGVKSMSFTLDGARERPYQPSQQQPHTMIECVSAVWTFRYTNGYIVHLRGPLTAHVVAASPVPPGTLNINPVQQWSLKFDELAFDATVHEKFVQLDAILGQRTISPLSPRIRNMNLAMHNSPGTTAAQFQQAQHQSDEEKRYEEPRMLINHASIPGEPVNAFGIPQATMRCLELAESVTSMGDLIVYSTETQLGPMARLQLPADALKKLAQRIREQNAAGAAGGSQQQSQQQQQQQQLQQPPPLPLQQQQQQIPPPQFMNTMPQNMNPSNPNNMNNSIAGPSNPNPFSYQQPGTLYSSAPPSVTNPPNLIASSSMSSPQNTSSSSTANSPEKQLKTIPQQQQAQQQQGGQGSQAQQQAPTPSQSGAAASPAVSSGTTTNTPALANATPKRKLGDASSPTTGTSDQPPPKRNARKRGRTNTNSGAG
ncbi:hypothetical protein CVT26_009170 [Gymnopilus dilepis]|uniref:LIM interaction domain-containing protein n=1 Tax=Gymnopilus dilepis TaxID=231916 RepID=A0A409Y9Z7_9AGAR|nr:hypothetical protein CVT26_009170 [Gymnopilus dilepis]